MIVRVRTPAAESWYTPQAGSLNVRMTTRTISFNPIGLFKLELISDETGKKDGCTSLLTASAALIVPGMKLFVTRYETA
jgi:hypothetical protein